MMATILGTRKIMYDLNQAYALHFFKFDNLGLFNGSCPVFFTSST